MGFLDPKPLTKQAADATYATPSAVSTALSDYDEANAGGYATVGARVEAVAVDGPFASVPAFNNTLENKRKWRKALGRVTAGTGFAKLLVAGDSTAWGLGAGGADDKAWPRLLALMLDRNYTPTQYSGIVPPSTASTGADADTRWTAGTGWVTTLFGFGGQACWQGNQTVTTNLRITPGINCDTIDIWYMRNTGLGTFGISVDGGAVVTQSTAGSLAWAKRTVTFAAGSSHTIDISVIAGNTAPVFIMYAEAYLSTSPSIRVLNAGVPNARAHAASGQPQWQGGLVASGGNMSLPGISAIAPDLTIFMLGVNDARIATASTGAQWEAAMRLLIAEAKLSGDVIIASVVPSSTAVTGAFALEQEYQARAKALAVELGCVYVDMLARYKDWATANAAGYMFDELHLTAEGGGDAALAFRSVITA